MKKILFAGAALALAVGMSGCASPGLPDIGQAVAAVKTSATDPVAAQARLDALKEVNRHIELCHRTYTLGWPFSGIVDCPAQNQAGAAASVPLTAADVASMISAALAKSQASPPAAAVPK